MRRPILISSLAFVLLAVAAGGASGGPGEITASAHGSYRFVGTAAGSHFDVYPFEFSVKIHDDGRVEGHYRYRQVRDGNALYVSGPLTCATIAGNRAWVGGLIEHSSRQSLIGLEMWFQVQDNGDGASSRLDMSSTIGAGGPGTGTAYCEDAPPVMFPFLLYRGNIEVFD